MADRTEWSPGRARDERDFGRYADEGYRGRDIEGRVYGAPTRAAREARSFADHRGRGPRGYRRSDERILEDVCERLTDDPRLDASGMDVSVEDGVVTLSGEARSRDDRRRAEDLIELISGVQDVQNRLKVRPGRDIDPLGPGAG